MRQFLSIVHVFLYLFSGPFQSPIRSMYLTSQERHLIVGLESGYVRILAQVGVCMYVYMYVCLYVHLRRCICMHVCMYGMHNIHFYVCKYIFTPT